MHIFISPYINQLRIFVLQHVPFNQKMFLRMMDRYFHRYVELSVKGGTDNIYSDFNPPDVRVTTTLNRMKWV